MRLYPYHITYAVFSGPDRLKPKNTHTKNKTQTNNTPNSNSNINHTRSKNNKSGKINGNVQKGEKNFKKHRIKKDQRKEK